ncbi:electron transfer flavoprotein subunit beta/FixA family protein [Capnocytophaga sp.]|uniref:electron transfer flavoprotein subunit beta/FixA family protein n=1 Tax=Capnocytophaga sp. TaxID=44737 RepID=UPI0026DA90C4|nr:electron transfer flavoprotein subunit beta/FixA family protein [Capnocytophaga sp.]MDO5105069.1 electron transfer flavoprotein subunit beta/FixA family protein [Capnocytophaga sp.]
MKILVCISSVPDTTSKINFTDENRKFDTTGVQFIINPSDEFGLTKAILLKEKLGASITLINVGTAETEPTLRKAFALGADEIIRINAVATDGFFVASQIAKIAREGAYDLIITGKESIDYNGGMVGATIAALLDVPFIDKCVSLEIDANSATSVREVESGKETVTAQLPLVVAGQKGLVEEKDLRIPNMRNLMAARTKQITVIETENTATHTTPVAFEKLPAKQAVKMISPDNLDQLIDLLHNEAKVI